MILRCILLLMALAIPLTGLAAPRLLELKPVASPGGQLSANVEWDDAGFIGILRMKIYAKNGDPFKDIELPEINPAPANLNWIDEEWVACESILGDRGSGFFYAHVPTGRGYLIEIIAPTPDADWILNFATNDGISTSAIHSLTQGRSSLFPLLLRDLPTDGTDYFTTAFCLELRDAFNAFTQYRKTENIKAIEFLSKPDVETSRGVLAVAAFDDKPHVVYFPAGTTTTKEMLQRTLRNALPPEASSRLMGVGAPAVTVNWTAEGGYEVKAAKPDATGSTASLALGKFDGVSDSPFHGPGVDDVISGNEDGGTEAGEAMVESSDEEDKSGGKDGEKSADGKKEAAVKSGKNSSKAKSASKGSKSPSRAR